MTRLSFTDLDLKVDNSFLKLNFGDKVIEIKKYLPQKEKVNLVSFIIEHALDEKTNTFSPIRLETYWGLAIVQWYTNIAFTDKQIEDAAITYDKLESSELLNKIFDLIPETEIRFLHECVKNTAEDYSKYANSAAGIISMMASDANNLNFEITDMLEKIQNKEGLEELSVIRDVVGRKVIAE